MKDKKMKESRLNISFHSKMKKTFKDNYFTKLHNFPKNLSSLSLKDTKQKLIYSLSKNPEYIMREYSKINPQDFNSYIETLDNSMNNYQLTFGNKDGNNSQEKNDSIKKYMKNNDDAKLIKKMYNSNKKFLSKGLTPRNDESNLKIIINDKKYSSPYQSLGVIKHNHFIYDELNKGFLNRQGDLFKQKILTIQKYKNKFRTKMPKIHISQSSKVPFDIPIVDLTEDKDKKNLSLLPNLTPKITGQLQLFSYYRYSNKNFPEGRE